VKYYKIHFTGTTGGVVQVLAKNKRDAWKQIGACDYVHAQVEDQVPDCGNMAIVFDRKSIELDADQSPCCELVPEIVKPVPAYDPTNLINLLGKPGVTFRQITDFIEAEEHQMDCKHEWGKNGLNETRCCICSKLKG
jgi:hypothetical protein